MSNYAAVLTGEARIAAFNQAHALSTRDALIVEHLRQFLSTDQVAQVLDILDDICLHCFDGPTWCQCANDE